jgi:DNA-binding NarL/FixJ family response regulator
MSEPIRVLIADDETIVRDGLRAIIELAPDLEVIAEAADGTEAVAAARDLHPDVALVDIQMPKLDGIETTRRLIALNPPPRVVILTTFNRNEYVYEAMKAGASGFLLKDIRRGQLTDAIRTVLAGDTLLAPTITRRLIEEFCRQPSPLGGTPLDLAELTPPRARSAHFRRTRTVQQPDRRTADRRRNHRQNPHRPHPHKAAPSRSRPSSRHRLRNRPDPSRQGPRSQLSPTVTESATTMITGCN